MTAVFDLTRSLTSSSLRFWRGTSASRTTRQPPQPPVFFDREGCPACRIVREALTELDLNVMIAPCPLGGKNLRSLKRSSGTDTLPKLYDPNTEQHLEGSAEILSYLFKQYADRPVPSHFKISTINRIRSISASLVRFNRGVRARPSRPAKDPLTLYSFESSPYSRPVREVLCELEIPYLLINLGKQQWADMGPAKPRLTPGPYRPVPGTKRDAFFKKHGNVQVPYLEDPNTGEALFESGEIVRYLERSYGS